MKKIMLFVLFAGLVSPVAAQLSAQVDQAQFKALKASLEKSLSDMDEAADRGNFNAVMRYAKQAITQAQMLAKQVPPGEKAAIINGEPTSKYLVEQEPVAREFYVLARMLKGEITLAQAISQNPALAKSYGFLGWVTGNVPYINVRYMYIADQVKKWKKCPTQVAYAQGKGVAKRSYEVVCDLL